jgi:hypothetical protein
MTYLMFQRIIVLQYEIDAKRKKNTKLSHNTLWDETTMKKKAVVCSTHGKKETREK